LSKINVASARFSQSVFAIFLSAHAILFRVASKKIEGTLVITTIFIIVSSNKIQNGDILHGIG